MNAVFATTLQKSNEWLRELADGLHLGGPEEAYQALRATLHALRDRLPIEEAVHLGAQLPMLLRGMFYEGWKPTASAVTVRSQEEFLALVRQKGNYVAVLTDTVRVTRGVLNFLMRHLTPGQVSDIRNLLPTPIATLVS
jgi:uncharacterized protein (DUF2267 family)